MSVISETSLLNVPAHCLHQISTSRAPSESVPDRPSTPSSVHSSSTELGDNDIIPPYSSTAPRTLVLCFDGTGDQFDSDNSNVIKFFSLLKRDDRREQMVYYQAGIGTYTSTQLATGVGQSVSKTLDEMIAWNLDSHVMSGYEFLMQNYEAGDKICLFGFSRGAYTARALAGMLHKVGLLPSHNHQQIPFAYKMYTRTDDLGWKQSTAFKKAFSIDIDIEFIGVWDTVCSVGLIPHRLPFTASNTAIRTFRHALSLDEHRAKFKANQYNRPNEYEKTLGTRPHEMPRPTMRGTRTHGQTRSRAMSPERFFDALKHDHARDAIMATTAANTTPAGTTKSTATVAVSAAKAQYGNTYVEEAVKIGSEAVEEVSESVEKTAGVATEVVQQTRNKLRGSAFSKFGSLRTLMWKKGKRLTEEENEFNEKDIIQDETDVKEVWFAGCHCDIGGGSVPDEEKHSLARIPLRWMVRECFRTKTGIRFHAELLKEIGLNPDSLCPEVLPPCNIGYGKAHAPALPPLIPSISFDPTPAKQTTAEPDEAKQSTHHQRHISVSTTRTLVNPTEGKGPCSEGQSAHEVLVDEEQEERADALCPIYDQLELKWWWWLLEFLPIEQRKQLPDNTWKKYTSINLGRGRTIPAETGQVLVHKSVLYRMGAKNLSGGLYKPKAVWGPKTKLIYVD